MTTNGDYCLHDMLKGTCTLCDPPDRKGRGPRGSQGAVFITKAGGSYHDSPECGGLRGGQSGAESQAMHVNPLEAVTLGEAVQRGKNRCNSCQPHR